MDQCMRKLLLFVIILNLQLICFLVDAKVPHLACPALQEKDLNYSAIKKLIQNPNCKIRSISDLLDVLPKSYLSHYSLMYRSRSLQGPHKDDYLNPRALVFGDLDKSKTVISFNGSPNQASHNGLEVLEINNQSGKQDVNIFKLYDIQFPLAEKDLGSLSWKNVQSKIAFSEANPPQCLTCHGQPVRPIFPSYPNWEGAFGSKAIGTVSNAEDEGMNAFINKVNSHEESRYQKLGKNFQAWGQATDFFEMQNEALNMSLGSVNAIRVARLIQQTPQYNKFRYAFLGAILKCDNFSELIPPNLRKDLFTNIESRIQLKSKWNQEKLNTFLKSIYNGTRLFNIYSWVYQEAPDGREDIKRSYPDFINNITQFTGESEEYNQLVIDTVSAQGENRGDPMSAGLRLLMEGRGYDMSNWFIDLTQPTYRFHNGNDAQGDAFSELLRNDLGIDSRLKDILLKHNESNSISEKSQYIHYLCQQIKPFSLKSLDGLRISLSAPMQAENSNNKYPNTFIKTCSQCHDSEHKIAPPIPFKNSIKMSQWLLQGDHRMLLQDKILTSDETLRMPPTSFLKDSEKNEILKYLNEFE